ncbi:MAG: YaiI/YqxD family protein [Lutisporaceae bacterium]
MKIYVDADACPVKQEIIAIADKYQLKAVFIFSTSHSGNLRLDEECKNAEIIMVDNVSQAADMAIINRVNSDDVVVTGDFGLASIILSKEAAAISFSGSLFNSGNIDKLLFERYLSSVIRRGGGKIKGPSKRSKQDDFKFKGALENVILKKMKDI